MTELINKSGVKRYAKKRIPNVSEDYYKALDSHVRNLVNASLVRAKKNQRSTLMARDL